MPLDFHSILAINFLIQSNIFNYMPILLLAKCVFYLLKMFFLTFYFDLSFFFLNNFSFLTCLGSSVYLKGNECVMFQNFFKN